MEHIADPIDRRLLNDWQRGFPITERPFAELARALMLDEAEVLNRLQRMIGSGRISRIGATCAPNTISASTLAAVAAPEERIEEVAAIIGAEPGVNHSYLRENHWNLWFVATGPDRDEVNASLERISARSGLRVLDLRLVRPFNIDLGFELTSNRPLAHSPRLVDVNAMQERDRNLLQMLTSGLPVVPRPFAELAAELGWTEPEVRARITALNKAGIVSRFGVIVRHRALGWSSNAMVVWDLSSEAINEAGPQLAAHPGITLCYERTPVDGVWPYRLYSMIHARSRAEALDVLTAATELPAMQGAEYEVLFSTRCFKQRGALIAHKKEVAA